MRNVRLLKLAALAASLLLVASGSYAVPILQLYLEGATFDQTSESWVLAAGPSARLWVIGDVNPGASIVDVHLAVAYSDLYNPLITLTPAEPGTHYGFADPSLAATPTSDGVAHTGVPQLDSGGEIGSHGIYGEGTLWQKFDLGNFTLMDSQMADFAGGYPQYFDTGENMGQISVFDVSVSSVSGEELPQDFALHFDVYNHVEGRNHSRFAPFSHDATAWLEPTEVIPPPVPEPMSMVMLGCIGAGMAAARKLRRRL